MGGLGIQQGIIIGIVVSILISVYRTSSAYVSITAPLSSYQSQGDKPFVDVRKYHTDEHSVSGVNIVRFDGPLYFPNTPRFRDTILQIVGKNSEASHKAEAIPNRE